MRAGRVFPLRVWLLGGIVGMVVAFYAGILSLIGLFNLLVPESALPAPTMSEAERQELYAWVEGARARWEEPAWQGELRQRLTGTNLTVWLLDGRGEALFFGYEALPAEPPGRAQPPTLATSPPIRTGLIYRDGALAGEVRWAQRYYGSLDPQQRRLQAQNRFMWAGLILTVVAVGWGAVTLASRSILRPLSAVAAAAGKISQGDLQFDVPATAIKELNQFATAFDQMREGLRESLTRQSELEQERRLFIGAIAHDLRTPLTSVRGYLEGLRDGVANTPEKRARYIQVAIEKTNTLERLIEGLFAYTRTEYLHETLQRQPVDLGDLLTAAVEGLRHRASASGIALALDSGPAPLAVSGDPHALGRVIDNLLENALRYTPTGGTVTVGWRVGLEHGRFWVRDTGPGVPPADLGRLFQPLYRGDRARGSGTGGAGLGLAIAAKLVAAHGGSIAVQNDAGAIFTVTLPLTEPKPPPSSHMV